MNKEVGLFVRTLKSKDLRVAFAESVTCGLAANILSTYKGTSEILAGSVVCYTPESKKSLLRISQQLIDRCTCESQEVTDALAKKLSSFIDAEIIATVTGLASEGGSETEEKPVGTIFFSVIYQNKLYHCEKLFRGKPLEIRKKACHFLYRYILDIIR